MANNVKINVDVVTNITGQDDVKKLQDSLNALSASNNSRVKSEKAYESAVKQRSVVQIAEENKIKQIQMDAHAASIASYLKEASSLSNITRLSQHKASIELEAAKQKKSINDAAAKQEKSLASETQKAQKYAYKFTAIEVKMGIEGAKARAKAEKEAAKEAEKADKAEIKANNEKLKQEQQLKKVSEQRLNSAVSSTSSLVQKTQSSFSRIKDIALGTLTAIGLDELFGNIGEQLSTATTNASSIVESENLLRATYNEGATSLLNWADSNAEAYGLANASAKQYLSFLTGVLNNTDISSDKLGSMAQNYTRLVGDMASAYNTEIDDAFQAIRSGIAGNTLAMQRYGIVLSVTNLQQYLQSKGIDTTYRSLDAASKQYVRYAYIMEHTAEVQGDYTRTSESFANSVKTLKNEWNNFLSLLGQYAIPLLMPIINALRTIIAYAGEVLKYIASIYGWEQYTTIAVDYSYQQVENIEDAVDSQEDLTKEVNNTNKALKSGVKLLDLYSLDFSDASNADDASAGTTQEKIPVSDQLEDLANIDYKVPDKLLPDVDVDLSKVKSIGDDIVAAFNVIKGIWDIIFVPFLVNPIKNWLKDDLLGKIERLLNTALGLLNIYFGAGPIKKWLTTKWNNLSPTVKSTLGIIGGTITSAIGSWSLGKAISDSIASGSPDLGSVAMGLVNTVGGIITAGVYGGPIGASVAAVVSAISGAVSFAIAENKRYAEAAASAMDKAMSGSISLSEELEGLPLFSNLDTLDDKLNGLDTANENLGSSISDVVANLESLSNSEFELPEGMSNTEYISQQLDTLNTSLNTFIETTAKPIAAAFADSLTGPGGLLESTTQTSEGLKKTLNTALELQAQDISGASQQLAELLAKADPTPEELERIEVLKTRIQSLNAVSKESEIASAFSDVDFREPNALLDKAEELNTKYRTLQDSNTKFFESLRADAEALGDYDLVAYWDLQIQLSEAQKDNISVQIQDFVDSAQEQAENRMNDLQMLKQYTIQYGIEANVDMAVNLNKKDFDFVLNQTLDGKTPVEYAAQELNLSRDQIIELEKNGKLERAIVWTNLISAQIKYGDFSDNWFLDDNATKKFKEELIKKYADWGYDAWFTEEGLEVSEPIKLSSYLTFNVDKVDTTDLEIKLNAASEKIETRGKTLGTDAAKATSEAAAEGFESAESTNKMTSAVEEGFTAALENVETPEEAKKKGSDLAESITSGVTNGFNTALAPGSEFMKAADNLTNTLVNIPTKFESAFKSAVNNVAGYINSLVNGLKQQLEGLNLPEGDLTVAQLYNSLKDSNFKIPMLANGGVIPANNPFLAVLGDQKSGVNVEAPVTVIQEAVRNVVNDPGTSDNIEVKVYIGDREIRDFVIDTVTANNLVVG